VASDEGAPLVISSPNSMQASVFFELAKAMIERGQA